MKHLFPILGIAVAIFLVWELYTYKQVASNCSFWDHLQNNCGQEGARA